MEIIIYLLFTIIYYPSNYLLLDLKNYKKQLTNEILIDQYVVQIKKGIYKNNINSQ